MTTNFEICERLNKKYCDTSQVDQNIPTASQIDQKIDESEACVYRETKEEIIRQLGDTNQRYLNIPISDDMATRDILDLVDKLRELNYHARAFDHEGHPIVAGNLKAKLVAFLEEILGPDAGKSAKDVYPKNDDNKNGEKKAEKETARRIAIYIPTAGEMTSFRHKTTFILDACNPFHVFCLPLLILICLKAMF